MLSKSEKEIAKAMDQYHWRAWLPVQVIADEMGRHPGHLNNSLLAMNKRHLVEMTTKDGSECYRLTSLCRSLVRA